MALFPWWDFNWNYCYRNHLRKDDYYLLIFHSLLPLSVATNLRTFGLSSVKIAKKIFKKPATKLVGDENKSHAELRLLLVFQSILTDYTSHVHGYACLAHHVYISLDYLVSFL